MTFTAKYKRQVQLALDLSQNSGQVNHPTTRKEEELHVSNLSYFLCHYFFSVNETWQQEG